MKKKLISVLALVAAVLATTNGFAGPREDEKEAVRALRGVPPPELPARAAQVVANAPAGSRSAVATAVLDAVAQRAPSSAPAVRSALVNSGVLPPTAAAAPRGASEGNNKDKGNGNNGNGNNGNGNGNNGNNGNSGNKEGGIRNGRYPTSPPHGGNPPGHNGQPGRKGPPPFVDYTKPRSF